jgi:hypothetical protein
MNFNLLEHTILLVVGGSRAYGIHIETSDVDLKGVAIPPAPYFHGFSQRFEQADSGSQMIPFVPFLNEEEKMAVANTKVEGSVYNLIKFVGMAVECNPNILDVLFCRDEEVRVMTPLGKKLRDHRDLFLSARAKHSFSGYAAAQLKRIKGHRQWLLNPPKSKPTRAEFGLPESTLIPADQLAAANAALRKKIDEWEFDFSGVSPSEIIHIENQIAGHLSEIQVSLGFNSKDDMKWLAAAKTIGLDDNMILILQREREYEASHRHWKQYTEWELKRNADRASLEAKYGYDTKHAAHLFRLLKMAREILETGKVNVWRGPGGPNDAEEVRAIRKGAWSYDQLVEWAEAEDTSLDVLYKERTYGVPKAPDRDAIEKLCIELVETSISVR